MASITIHDVDEALQSRLRVRAGDHGRSMEEARYILVAALGGGAGPAGGLAASIRARFGALGGVEMPEVAREPMRAVFAATREEDVFGCLGPVAEARTVEEMDAGIMAEVGRRRALGQY